MEWFPIAAGAFKGIALATGMFFAVKWHYDQGKKEQDPSKARRAVLHGVGKAVLGFTLSALVLGGFTLFLISKLHLNLTYP